MDQDWLMKEKDLTLIKIPYPKEKDLKLKITAPRCRIEIAPGLGGAWVSGRYTDLKYIAPLGIQQARNVLELLADSSTSYRAPISYLPELKLTFGRQKPFALSIRAGELCGKLDFGGLPLTTLEIQYESGEQEIDFSYPAPKALNKIELTVDSGPVLIDHLENASPAEMHLNGDAARYRMIICGDLQQNLTLRIGLYAANVELVIPSGLAATVRHSYPPDTNTLDGFEPVGKEWWNSPARDHKQPLLRIFNTTAQGSLRIQTI